MKHLQILTILLLVSVGGFANDGTPAMQTKTLPLQPVHPKKIELKHLDSQVVQALKQALSIGVDSAVTRLSSLNGFFKDEIIKILLPPEAANLLVKLNKSRAGRRVYNKTMKPIVNDLVLSMNRAAEDASQKASPIFMDAIKTMTIPDALNILNGPDTAATGYLHDRTYDSLVVIFKPAIQGSLDKKLVGNQSTSDIWAKFINTYKEVSNSPVSRFLNLDAPTETDLSKYVTMKALDGVFYKVGEEEKKIRENPKAQVTNLLKNVFGGLKKKSGK